MCFFIPSSCLQLRETFSNTLLSIDKHRKIKAEIMNKILQSSFLKRNVPKDTEIIPDKIMPGKRPTLISEAQRLKSLPIIQNI